MADKYFDKFPKIKYSNNTVVDITKRVTLLDRVSRNPYVFYNYDLEDERADQFSFRYYGDPFKSWILYISNEIVDPYYEWYLQNDEFEGYIEKKYGSIYLAQQKIKHYRNNWENQDPITPSEYNALPISKQKYWNPDYSSGNNVYQYVRKEIDWLTNTNRVVSYTVSNTDFISNEICEVHIANNFVGYGQVSQAANNYLYLQHVSGYYIDTDDLAIDGNSYVYGTESNVNTVVTDISNIANNLSEAELVYWDAITYYDYEVERNEYNKSIRVIDSDLKFVAVNNLRTLLEED